MTGQIYVAMSGLTPTHTAVPAEKTSRKVLAVPVAPEAAPCAECPETAPFGRAYCSTRCRNAADRHDEMDGDL